MARTFPSDFSWNAGLMVFSCKKTNEEARFENHQHLTNYLDFYTEESQKNEVMYKGSFS